MEIFGDFVRKMRIRNLLTLREFFRQVNVDPSNWSKIEMGLFPPPKSKQILQGIASILNLEEKTEEYNTLFDLAAISYIPPDLISDQAVVEKLPIFFRTLRGEKPSKAELEELLKMLKEE